MNRFGSLCVYFFCVTFAVVSHAQFEDLFNNPDSIEESEFAEKSPKADIAAAAEEPTPLLRLLSPSPHRERVVAMDVSPDGRYALTRSNRTLKIWDLEQRVSISSYTTVSDRYPIRFAGFRSDSKGIWMMTDPRRIESYNLDLEQRQSVVPARGMLGKHLAMDPERTRIVGASYGAKYNRLSVAAADLETKKLTQIFTRLTLTEHGIPLTEGQQLVGFTVHPDGELALARFSGRQPALLLNLKTSDVVGSIPWVKGSIGFLPDGRLLSHTYNGTANIYSSLNPVTFEAKEIFARVPDEIYRPTLPKRLGDPLVLRSGDALVLYDFERKQATDNLSIAGRFTDAVASIQAQRERRYLLAQMTLSEARDEVAASYLTTVNPETQTYGADWSIRTFQPRFLAASGSDFEFLVHDGARVRKVTLTEAGLDSEELNTIGGKQLDWLLPHYDAAAREWIFVSKSAGTFFKLDSATGEYSRGAVFQGRSRDALNAAARTYHLDQSSDGSKLARYHQRAVTVTDFNTSQVIREIAVPSSYAISKDVRQRVALSPDATKVAFAYSMKSDEGTIDSVECYDVLSGELLWEHTSDRPYERIDHLRFNRDGRLLYLVGPADRPSGTNAFSARFASTGELSEIYNGWSAGDIIYNQGGTLAARFSNKQVAVMALPAGKVIATMTLDVQPGALSFIGSDNFLIAHSHADETIRLIDIREQSVVAEMKLFDDPQKWLAMHPETGLFASEPSIQQTLKFIQGTAITPLAAYFEELYRPRLLGSLVKGLTPRPSIPISDLKYAPKLTLRIDGPKTRGLTVEDEFETFELPSSEVTLVIEASCVGSPVSDLRIYQNGKLVEGATRGLFVEDDDSFEEPEVFERSLKRSFELLPGKNRFRAVALNAQGSESVPDEVIVYSQGSAAPESDRGIALHMLFIGIDAYANPDYNLNYARKDASTVMNLLDASYGDLFSRKRVYSLFDQDATRENILATLETIQSEANPRDAFIFYFAGHGVVSTDERAEFFLAPYESRQLYGEARQLEGVGVSSTELLEYSRDIAAQKQLFILDACQSAGALATVAVRGAAEEKAIAQLARSTGTHWLTATGSEQFAAEFATLGHGAFTYTLLEGLKGKADSGDGIVSVNELKAYIEARVPEVTAEHKGEAQYPASYGYGQDFPLLVP